MVGIVDFTNPWGGDEACAEDTQDHDDDDDDTQPGQVGDCDGEAAAAIVAQGGTVGIGSDAKRARKGHLTTNFLIYIKTHNINPKTPKQ